METHTEEVITTENSVNAEINQSSESTSPQLEAVATASVVETPIVSEELSARTQKSQKVVFNYALGSVVVGGAVLIPVPGTIMVALTALQLTMLHSLAKRYEVKFSKNVGKSLIASLLSGVVTTETAVPVASLVRMIPIVGMVAGGISVAALSFATTYAVGNIFIQHFESGGTLLDFDPAKTREYFVTQFKQGQVLAAEAKVS